MKKNVIIYTDGACSGNPGPGGWGAVLFYGSAQKEISGYVADTTNNRMELQAAIEALASLRRPMEVELYTDSRYVRDGITKWLPGWRNNNWKRRDKKPLKNIDLWKTLDALQQKHTVAWRWVRGHDGNVGNELADSLARKAVEKNSR